MFLELSTKYVEDQVLLSDIVSTIPKRIEYVLNHYKSSLVGQVPKSRDEFQPEELLRKLAGGEKVIVMDSRKDLPIGWKNMNLVEQYHDVLPLQVNGEADPGDSGGSSGGDSEGHSSIFSCIYIQLAKK